MAGILYLIPNVIDENALDATIPSYVQKTATSLTHFIAENEKVCRRYLKKIDREIDINQCQFYDMGKHADTSLFPSYIKVLEDGHDMGLISDAGCPAIADPGFELVKLAHKKNIKVIPLTGPSSILLALISSGMNGQAFSFHGYLPHDKGDRERKIKAMEKSVIQEGYTQIFMDTPFRNNKLIEEVIRTCNKDLRLSVSSELTGPNEKVLCYTIAEWKKIKYDYKKVPVMICLGK